ncbi:hypothetical protein DFH07DRAFT_854419 [Mycena maculata]|uniref:F-box domain-containing protein n=1 Tax=Mycena maculata TaxID=230809 RepID=A0AAD7HNW1_9AGAR|nr:hypothetical protein DFH07DRAFT_854419 [Mycena maculata]
MESALFESVVINSSATTPNDLRMRVQNLDAQIVHYRALLSRLEGERKFFVFQLSKIPYPILNLPLEIASEIFHHCRDPSEVAHPSKTPLLLLRVCREWRQIALSLPRLWTSFACDIGSMPDFHSSLRLFETWTSRAWGLPISLKCEGADHFPNVEDISALVFGHPTQLRELELELGRRRLIDLPNVVFPMLTVLTLRLRNWQVLDNHTVVSAFRNAFRLTAVHLDSGLFPSNVALNWNLVTTFSCKDIRVNKCLDVLRLAPNLKDCTFHFGYLGHPEPIVPVSSNFLQSLTLFQTSESGGKADLLRHMTLPALQCLRISEFGDSILPTVVPFIIRSAAPLRCLSMDRLAKPTTKSTGARTHGWYSSSPFPHFPPSKNSSSGIQTGATWTFCHIPFFKDARRARTLRDCVHSAYSGPRISRRTLTPPQSRCCRTCPLRGWSYTWARRRGAISAHPRRARMHRRG